MASVFSSDSEEEWAPKYSRRPVRPLANDLTGDSESSDGEDETGNSNNRSNRSDDSLAPNLIIRKPNPANDRRSYERKKNKSKETKDAVPENVELAKESADEDSSFASAYDNTSDIEGIQNVQDTSSENFEESFEVLEASAGSEKRGGGYRSSSDESANKTAEETQRVNDSGSQEDSGRDELPSLQSSSRVKSAVSGKESTKMFQTSTPLVDKTHRVPVNVFNVSAITPGIQVGNDKYKAWRGRLSPPVETTTDIRDSGHSSSSNTTGDTSDPIPTLNKKKLSNNLTSNEDCEDIVIAGLQDITIAGAKNKKFTFKSKGDQQGSSKPADLPGATSSHYFDEEDEEDDDESSLSANFNLGDDEEDSSLHSIEPPGFPQKGVVKEKSAALSRKNDSDDLQVITEKIGKIPLGQQQRKADPPKIRFLSNPPTPAEYQPKVYAYDPLNAKHQEFYGDVQRTVAKLAQVIENMPVPVPSSEIDKEICPSSLLVPLYDHQLYGLQWLSWREAEFPGGGILADEMGLGKTIMIISLLLKSKSEWVPESNENWINSDIRQKLVPSRTTLVVCPVGCLLQWSEEMKTKARGLKVHVYHGPSRTTSAALLSQHDVVLTTYSTLGSEISTENDLRPNQKSKSPLLRIYFRRIVLDEAHNIRNPKTKSANAICQLHSRHRWAVTGTPVHNRPEDFYSMVKFLRMVPFDDAKVWDFWIGLKQVRKTKEAQDRLQILGKSLLLRRTKAEVESIGGNVQAIPPKKIEDVEVEMTEAEQRVYDHLMKFSQDMFKDFLKKKQERDRELQTAAYTYGGGRQKKSNKGDAPDDIKFSHLFALIIRLRQCAVLPHLIETMLEDEDVGKDPSFDELREDHIVSKRNPIFDRLYESSKVKRILEDIKTLRQVAQSKGQEMDKVVIVSSWTTILHILYDHLVAARFSAVFITGKDKMEDRMDAMKNFNNNPKRPQITLLSLAAGGVGLNLTGGNHVFFIEPHWNPQLELQAQDRVHRFGQTKNVFIKRYLTKGTIETRVMELQKAKLDLADGVLNNTKKKPGGGLSIAQMRHLFQV